MGLAASQARYIFITQRKISLEGALMANSNKQIRLAQESAELSEEKQDALSQKEWQFKGESGFNYDMLMGDSALNSGEEPYLVMTNGTNGKVVLNNKYAAAMQTAGIQPTGGQYSVSSLANFMAVVAGSPKEANSWSEVIYNPELEARNNAINTASTFLETYGAEAPQQGMDPSKTETTVKSEMTFSEVLSKMGNTGNFSNINNLDGRSRAGSQKIQEQTNVNGSYSNLVKTNGYVCLIDDEEDLSYDEIWSRARKGFENLANNIINKIASATGIAGLQQKLKPYIEEMQGYINGDLSRTEDGDEDDARDGGRDTAKKSMIGVGVDDTGTDEVWVYCNPAELTRRLLIATADVCHNQNSGRVNFSANIAPQGCSTGYSPNATITQYEQKEHPYTNDHEKTYEEWNNAYSKLSEDAKKIVKGGDLPQITQYEKDTETLEKYKQIYNEALNGWTYDKDVNNRDYLTNKLTNNQYLIKHNNKTTTMKQADDFALVSKFDKDEIEAYYDTKEKEFKVKDKKLQAEQDRIQVELTAINTEQESVKTLIQKNIEKGFTFGYDA